LRTAKSAFADGLQMLLDKAKPKSVAKDIKRLQGEGGAQTAVGAQAALGAAETSLPPKIQSTIEKAAHELQHGSVVIAAITSCTNTSNPSVLIAAGLLAKKAVERSLQTKPWVKTSLAPGSKVVTDYLIESGLMRYLQQLRFFLVGYGCTTCIGNSGPLPAAI